MSPPTTTKPSFASHRRAASQAETSCTPVQAESTSLHHSRRHATWATLAVRGQRRCPCPILTREADAAARSPLVRAATSTAPAASPIQPGAIYGEAAAQARAIADHGRSPTYTKGARPNSKLSLVQALHLCLRLLQSRTGLPRPYGS